ncbi:GNAT family N-acetyltransferase [Aureimonas leprariae]|uniref:N-acetyltransferase n=1 Tax=Plantimonas leprariae TaxID=2615207 RepID=A0A7V7TWJ4_9HYPH|nr:N-acetyltransferase [Aureimonas leprariae]KAB0680023.1 N-acetyltransferase [Aureimonas leprariae]
MPIVTLGYECAGDAAAREALLDLAMGANRRRKSSEAIRRGRLPAEGLSFAATDEAGTLVGTVRLWNVAAGDDGRPALLLGPLAVAPTHAGLGVGSRLMRRAVAKAAWLGHAAILLVGDPEYYERFGFAAAPAADLAMPGPFERHRLLGLELAPGALAGAAGLIRPTGAEARDEAALDLAVGA